MGFPADGLGPSCGVLENRPFFMIISFRPSRITGADLGGDAGESFGVEEPVWARPAVPEIRQKRMR
jgi:hypothetical protein